MNCSTVDPVPMRAPFVFDEGQRCFGGEAFFLLRIQQTPTSRNNCARLRGHSWLLAKAYFFLAAFFFATFFFAFFTFAAMLETPLSG